MRLEKEKNRRETRRKVECGMMIRAMWPKRKKRSFNNIIMIMIRHEKQKLLPRYVGMEGVKAR